MNKYLAILTITIAFVIGMICPISVSAYGGSTQFVNCDAEDYVSYIRDADTGVGYICVSNTYGVAMALRYNPDGTLYTG